KVSRELQVTSARSFTQRSLHLYGVDRESILRENVVIGQKSKQLPALNGEQNTLEAVTLSALLILERFFGGGQVEGLFFQVLLTHFLDERDQAAGPIRPGQTRSIPKLLAENVVNRFCDTEGLGRKPR